MSERIRDNATVDYTEDIQALVKSINSLCQVVRELKDEHIKIQTRLLDEIRRLQRPF